MINLSKFIQVYIDSTIITESIEILPIEESVGSVLASIKERLLKWFKAIKEKIVSFFKRVREFITKIANIAINQIKRLFSKCKEIANKYSSVKESWTEEEKKNAVNKDWLTTTLPSKCADAGGFKNLNFDDFFMYHVTSFFNGLRDAALNNDNDRYNELCKIIDDRLNLSNNSYRLEVVGNNVMVETDMFTDDGCAEMINTAKDVCNSVISKATAKFDEGIRKLESAIRSKQDITKEYSAFVQKCINKMSMISTHVRDYIMNNIYVNYVYRVQDGARKLARYKMSKLGASAGDQIADYCNKGWSLRSMISSLFKSKPKQSPVLA